MLLYDNGILLILYCCVAVLRRVDSLSTPTNTKVTSTCSLNAGENDPSPPSTTTFPKTVSFSVPLIRARPKPESFVDSFLELWNDPRPVTTLLLSSDRSKVGAQEMKGGKMKDIPYCIISDEFQIDTESFQVLLYPRGRFESGSSSSISVGGPASAYLRYLPKAYGDEVDIAWNLQLGIGDQAFAVSTSGGLPKSNTTWSAAMTFCTEMEAVESVGRATDWGSSIWNSNDVCNGFGNLVAQGRVTIFDRRTGESSFALRWPPFSKGAIGAVIKASSHSLPRDFRVGEVIVPRDLPDFKDTTSTLKENYFVFPGTDYRIMTMSDMHGNPIFSTQSLTSDGDKEQARLALRPCGWKLQQQQFERKGMKTDWPIEVPAGLLSNVTSTRFNPESALPRVIAAFQRDWKAYTLALAVAITPIPLALFVRTFVSFYAIPSASMEPTLLKGDVLLVEKFPRVYDRTNRGDVILFQPPSALKDIVNSSGGGRNKLSSTSLFVKRMVGLPGDEKIHLDRRDNDITINGQPPLGPDRSLCRDEPLRLIDKLILENSNGKDIDILGKEDVYVLGDCKAVSVDSRVFGVLPKDNIVGKPVARLWPLDRIQLSNKF